jgi:hypothetical protein
VKVEGLVGTEVGKEVEADIAKGEQAEHAAKTDEVGEMEEFAKGSDREGDQEEAKSPVTSEVLDEFDGVGAELAGISARTEKAQRGEAS